VSGGPHAALRRADPLGDLAAGQTVDGAEPQDVERPWVETLERVAHGRRRRRHRDGHELAAVTAASMTPAPTAEYGGYLANAVANCVTCHTTIDMATGKRVGVSFAGGNDLPSHGATGRNYLTPSLTATDPASPMPWTAFSRMTPDDVRAIYRYLRSLSPSPMGAEAQ
jgi:mono/diheme cytochrome c family protein